MKATFTNVSLKTIGRRYQLLEKLGEGGMGAAFKVLDKLTGDVVTLKRGLAPEVPEDVPIGHYPGTVDPRDDDDRTVFPDSDDDGGDGKTIFPGDPISGDELTIAPTIFGENDDRSSMLGSDWESEADKTGVVVTGGVQIKLKERDPYGENATVWGDEPSPVVDSDATMMPRTMVGDRSINLAQDPKRKLALAKEFAVLAGLRHPNIISVLDYGFDDKGQPYFTMELVPAARDLVAASRGATLSVKVAYLLQMLEALTYLHRRGVIHRDLKPSNVLVSAGRVKVLDFGISMFRDEISNNTGVLAGTIGYIAPEVLCGSPVSEASDIYAVGVIASRSVFGCAPSQMVDIDVEQMNGDTAHLSALRTVIRSLVKAIPEDRVSSAQEAIAALSNAIDQPLPAESEAAREGYLQAADFVGREEEMDLLYKAFRKASVGRGGAYLVAGESGVGKSRILSELRTQSLVHGAMVLRGQAVRNGGSAYQLWRDVASRLVLGTTLSGLEASVLKALVPDIGRLIQSDGPVEDPPEQDPDASQARLIEVLTDVLERQERPVLLVLEDLHWARVESLKVIAALYRKLRHMQVFLVGSYRDDEDSQVADLLGDLPLLKLDRLSEDAIERLAESVLGDSGRDAAVLELLRRETEGNPFFLVEVVRAYAEVAGRLDQIAGADLTQKLLPQGIASLITRRLDRFDDADRGMMRLAAIISREVDESLLKAAAPDIDWSEKLSDWGNAAVLRVEEGGWRFAHDKIREQLVAEVDATGQVVDTHRRAAEIIESVYGDNADHTVALAWHWGKAKNTEKEAHYTGLAGETAVRLGACEEAVKHLERALELLGGDTEMPEATTPRGSRFISELMGVDTQLDPDSERVRRGHLEGLLSEALCQLGELHKGLDHARRALAWLGQPMPDSVPGHAFGLMGQGILRAFQSKLPSLYQERASRSRTTRLMATAIQTRATETFFYTQEPLPLFWSAFRMLNLGQPAGPSPDLAKGYILMGVVLGVMPMHGMAKACCERALEIAHQVGSPYELGFVGQRNAVYHIYLGRWDEVHVGLDEVLRIAEQVRNPRQLLESRTIRAFALQYQGRFDESNEAFAEVYGLARQNENAQAQIWSLTGLGYTQMRMGNQREALKFYERALAFVGEETASADAISFRGMEALLRVRSGHATDALRAIDQSIELIEAQAPVAYWTQPGISATAEACFELLKTGEASKAKVVDRARKVVKAMAAFGKKFPFGAPFARLWEGELHLADGQSGKAREAFEAAIEIATELSMTYELGRAHLALARMPGTGAAKRDRHRTMAIRTLAPLGALGKANEDTATHDLNAT